MRAVTSLNSPSRDARSSSIWLLTASDSDNGPGVSRERCLVTPIPLKPYSSMDLKRDDATSPPWAQAFSIHLLLGETP